MTDPLSEDSNMFDVVIVGDSYVGKTSLIYSYAHQQFQEIHQPTVFEQYTMGKIIQSNSKRQEVRQFKLKVWDVSGKPEHQSLRQFAYSKADVVVFCFSLASSQIFDSQDPSQSSKTHAQISLNHVETQWIPEVMTEMKANNREPILILVGTKSDQLFNNKEELWEAEDGNKMYERALQQETADIKSKCDELVKTYAMADYLQTSALFYENVKNIFDLAMQ